MRKRLSALAATGHHLSVTARLLAELLTDNHRLRIAQHCVLTRAELAAKLWPDRKVTDWRKRMVGFALHELHAAGLIGLDVTRRQPGQRGEPGVEQRLTVRRIAFTDPAPPTPAQPALPLGPVLAYRRSKPKPKHTRTPALPPAAAMTTDDAIALYRRAKARKKRRHPLFG